MDGGGLSLRLGEVAESPARKPLRPNLHDQQRQSIVLFGPEPALSWVTGPLVPPDIARRFLPHPPQRPCPRSDSQRRPQ